MNVLLACVCVYHMCPLCLWRSKEGLRSLNIDGCEPPCEFRELNSSPLEEQLLLTIELSLHHHPNLFFPMESTLKSISTYKTMSAVSNILIRPNKALRSLSYGVVMSQKAINRSLTWLQLWTIVLGRYIHMYLLNNPFSPTHASPVKNLPQAKAHNSSTH